ncbi:MAG: SDR family NAD(P)-dependent oxidoreductase [Myxococcota bacterium]
MNNTETTKVAVVSGVTRGIGRAVALGLVERGYSLKVLARSEEAFEQLREEVLQRKASASLKLYLADLSLVESTSRALSALLSEGSEIDILFQSAGLIPRAIEHTSEGIERTFAVSFLTRFQVARRLVPAMARQGRGLFLNMAGAGQNGRVFFDDPNFRKTPFKPMKVVKQFQQANDAMVMALDEDFRGDGVRSFCLMPGLVDTGIHDSWPPALRFMMRNLMRPILMKSPESAASVPLAIVDGALEPGSPLVGSNGETLRPSSALKTSSYRQQVRQMAEELIERALPEDR